MTKPMSAAEYAAHAERIKADRPTEIVMLKSGSVFELRKPDLREMVQLGVVPQALVTESLKSLKEKGDYVPTDTPEIKIDGLILQREVVSACCVQPPFNELTAKSFLKEDFDEIYLWGMSHQGVEGAEALKKFRKGRKRRAARGRADGTKLQPETISTADN